MARIVTKVIRGHAYRYHVEGIRDPESGKAKTKWTYLGPADDTGELKAPKPRDETRARILAALKKLLEEDETGDTIPSAGTIANEAGVAHGTFYRYFSNKEAALDAVMENFLASVRESRPNPALVPHDRNAARAEMARYVRSASLPTSTHPGVLRAGFRRLFVNLDLRRVQEERRLHSSANLTAYLAMLHQQGLADIPQPRGLAHAILLLLEGPYRALIERIELDASTLDGIAELVDRAVFAGKQ